MALNVDILSVNELYINGVNILENKRDYIELVGDEKIIIDVPSSTYTKTVPQTGVNLGDLELKTTPLDGKTFDSINNAGGIVVDGFSYEVDSIGAYVQDVNIDTFTIGQSSALKTIDFTTYKIIDSVKTIQHTGSITSSDIEYADYTVNYGTLLDPWVAVEPTITTSGEPFTLIDATVTSINTFTTTETIQIGDIVSADRETFGTVVLSDNGEYMIDTDIFFDGTTEKDLDVSDVNIINFVQDTRASSYANGLRDALLSTVNKTIYGHTYNDIIIDAGLGGHFVLGTLYTTGGLNDSDKTTQFQIQLSDDGIEYTTVYENLEDLSSNHAHLMTGTGRFIKIVFLDEVDGWGRINTNIVNGKWWNLKIIHPLSTVYKYNVKLSINGKLIVPKYIQWFDNMTINKIVCGKVFINPTTVLKIDSENVAKVELDLWQEVKGVY